MEKKLIGMQVMHKKTHAIGTIVNINGDTITVEFHGQLSKFSYPSVFASILELEDEELQKELESVSSEADFDDFKRAYAHSINNEIFYLKSNGGKKHYAFDGELIKTNSADYLYSFDTDTELHFSDGTMAKLWFDNEFVLGYIVSCEEFSITIRSKSYLGDHVDQLEFCVEEWFLLEQLLERLNELQPDKNSIAYKLACKGSLMTDERSRIVCGQESAVRRALNNDITFIWGPPGTGKTKTLSDIALDYMSQGKRVLMLSYSNVSVDGALLRVTGLADYPAGQIVRYGYPRMQAVLEHPTLTAYQYVLSMNPDLAEAYRMLNAEKRKLRRKDPRRIEINKKLKEIRQDLLIREVQVVQSALFVATTVSKAIADGVVYSQNFDVVIFDEASMAYVPQIVFAASLAREAFVCLGDFCQLPAIVQNPTEQKLTEDIFEYVGITNAVDCGYGHEWLVMLNTQYRMHPAIAEFVGKHMYMNNLHTSERIYEKTKKIAKCKPLETEAMSLIDVSDMYSVSIKTRDGSRINLLTALLSIRLAELYIDRFEVGLITPYNAQSRLMLAMVRDLREKNETFKKVSCATVHQFQGSEKSIIIYDAVDCYRMPYPGTLLTTIKNNTANRLFNVALTRTQGKFMMIANRDYLKRKNISKKLMFTQLIDKIHHQGAVLYGDDILDACAPYKNERPGCFVEDRERTWTAFMQDILNAQDEIRIEIPGLLDENYEAMEQFKTALEELDSNEVDIVIRTEENIVLPTFMQPYEIKHSYVTNPVTIIDKRIVWYGHPLSSVDFIVEGNMVPTEYFPCIRLEGKHTARIIQAFLDIPK